MDMFKNTKISTILFDLDGTLLPMDQDIFVKAYFGGIAAKLAKHGYDPDELIAAIWKGTKEMIQNNGEQTNEKVFWKSFCKTFGEKAIEDEPLFYEFYKTEFDNVKTVCGFNQKAADVVRAAKKKGFRVALATNPIFPSIATNKRIRWAGLDPDDFELYTTYENAHFSKPNLDYYREVAKKLGVSPNECLMVGNDVEEDMVAKDVGMDVFLLTDCLINKYDKDVSIYPHGTFDELLEYIEVKL